MYVKKSLSKACTRHVEFDLQTTEIYENPARHNLGGWQNSAETCCNYRQHLAQEVFPLQFVNEY